MPVVELGLLLGSIPSRSCLSTRIIVVDTTPSSRNAQNQARDDPLQGRGRSDGDHQRGLNLLGLIAEHVSELASAQPEQTLPLPVPLPEAPYLDAVVQTPEGIVQLILVEEIRDIIARRSGWQAHGDQAGVVERSLGHWHAEAKAQPETEG